ncbi:MAG: hypothetical protein IJ744_06355 [Lachnospiraceae bacterium]|nr:hypothetical protein [Lachnospiraceae bacterium]
MKEPIVIYDKEEGYARGLLMQMERMHFPVSECVIITRLELLRQILKRPIELLIATDDVEALLPGHQIRCVVILSEGRAAHETSLFPSVYKYQSMEEVMNEILTIYSEIGGDAITLNYTNDDPKKIIVVYSPSSGLSRTMFAMALAKEYAKRVETLYLPFEAFTVENLMDGRGGMSDLIYYLREQSGQIGLRIQMMAHKEDHLSYLTPVGHYLDVNEATIKEFRYLVKELKENSPYDVCILEMGYFNRHVALLMNLCDQVYLPYENVSGEELLGTKVGEEKRVQAFHRALIHEGMSEVLQKMTAVPIPVDDVDWSQASEVLRALREDPWDDGTGWRRR